MHAQLLQSYPTLCDPMDWSPLGSSVHGISQARLLELVAIAFSRGSSQCRGQICVSFTGRQIVYPWATREMLRIWLNVQFSHSVMSDSMRPPSFSVHGILQARILEWIAMPSSRGSSPLRDWTQVLCITGGLHHLMEKAMATHSSTLAWKIPWTAEPGRLQSMGSLRVGHDWATSLP